MWPSSTNRDNRLGLFLLVSIALHVLLVALAPRMQWGGMPTVGVPDGSPLIQVYALPPERVARSGPTVPQAQAAPRQPQAQQVAKPPATAPTPQPKPPAPAPRAQQANPNTRSSPANPPAQTAAAGGQASPSASTTVLTSSAGTEAVRAGQAPAHPGNQASAAGGSNRTDAVEQPKVESPAGEISGGTTPGEAQSVPQPPAPPKGTAMMGGRGGFPFPKDLTNANLTAPIVVTLNVRVKANGEVETAQLLKPTGNQVADRYALRVAQSSEVKYGAHTRPYEVQVMVRFIPGTGKPPEVILEANDALIREL